MDGGEYLTSLEYQVLEAKTALKASKDTINDIKKDTRHLEESKNLAEATFKGITDGYEAREVTLQATVTRKQQELADLDARIAAANEDLKAAIAETADKHKQLAVKEQAILAKREALRTELQDMQYKQRRSTSAASLYDIE